MTRDNLIDDLASSWQIIAGKYTADVTLVNQLFGEIQSAYTADQRYYHDVSHIHSLLDLSDQYAKHMRNKKLIDFAIFYHDIIYNVSRLDNEERSAGIAKERLTQLLVPGAEIAVVVDHILASKQHVMEDPTNQTDRAWFLDFDMSILGTEWDTYLQYSQNVRQEYRLYPDIIYNAGRETFLHSTLTRKFIFYTPEFRNQFEQQARENLQRELSLLYTV